MTTVPQFTVYPSRNDSPDTFADDGDQFLSEMPDFIAAVNTVAGEINTSAATADTSAGDAAASAADAADQVTLATAQVTLATTQATAAAASATAASGYASTALNAPGTSGTSTTSLTIGTGSKSLTAQTGKLWVPGQPVVIARTSAPTTTYMAAITSTYDPATGAWTGTVPTGWAIGSGTFTDWTISLAPSPLSALAWSILTGTPTTNAGYGITDSGVILLSSASPSSVATVDFTSGISATYSEYELRCRNVIPASDGAVFQALVSNDGGSNYLTSYNTTAIRTVGTTQTAESASTSAILLSGTGGVDGTSTGPGISGVFRLFNPAGANVKQFDFDMNCRVLSAGAQEKSVGNARQTSTSAINAVRLKFSTGNIASGQISLRGIR
jgi:hypothetical protein